MDGATKHLLPSTLGIGLVEGYNQIGFDRSLSKPQLRREVCVPSLFTVFSGAESSVLRIYLMHTLVIYEQCPDPR